MTVSYHARLEELSHRLDGFCARAENNESLDFAHIVEDITSCLEGFDEANIQADEKILLENIAQRLTRLTQKATQELQTLKDEMTHNARHAKGLKAYSRGQYNE